MTTPENQAARLEEYRRHMDIATAQILEALKEQSDKLDQVNERFHGVELTLANIKSEAARRDDQVETRLRKIESVHSRIGNFIVTCLTAAALAVIGYFMNLWFTVSGGK